MKLRARAKISVVEHWNRNVTPAVNIVRRARIINVVRTRFTRLIHYRLEPPSAVSLASENDGTVSLDAKGTKWVAGWKGPQVRALSTVAALGE